MTVPIAHDDPDHPDNARPARQADAEPAGAPTDLWLEIATSIADASRAHEMRVAQNDLLVNGRLLVTEAAHERLKADALPAKQTGLPSFATIDVLVIPEDGDVHDVGAGKVA